MVSKLRLLLIVLLVLLQSIAPLVHAHTGDGFRSVAGGTLHVPGLETYVVSDSGSQSCRLAVSAMPSEGLVVAINTGIKQDYDAAFCTVSAGLPAVSPVIFLFSPSLVSYIPLPSPVPLMRPLVSAHNPRAPPAQ